VTPGDVYRITFVLGGDRVSNEVLVESDYTVNLNIFGKINAQNMSFSALKPIVEKTITTAYPRSMPFLNIVSVGIFQVLIKGEVPQTTYVYAWGLSRLSSVIKDYLGPYSSIRDIGIISGDGTLRKYDLFKALQLGIVEEDPYIQPGDSIVISRRDREVEVKGEVYRPGKFQLLKGQGLNDLLNLYGRGLTNMADTGRVRLDRFAERQGRTIYLNLSKGIPASLELEDGDVLTIPAKTANMPVVFFEGAILQAAATSQVVVSEAVEVGLETYNRITHSFIDGESLLDAFLTIKDSVSPTADLSSAQLIRADGSNPIPVNLEKLMYNYDPAADIALQPFDRIVIPALWFNVSVVGDVENPGVYPYVPRKTYSYYLSLAGGIPTGQAANYISLVDAGDKLRGLDEFILPGDRIVVTASLITVAGAVYNPGSYSFVPGKAFEYYVDLAGGIDPEKNNDNKVRVTDSSGKRLNSTKIITPGDRIFVQTNDFAYNFNRYFPMITASISLITAIITVVNLVAE
jgi:protein involved in polysaccharide export with SLBB domain